MKNFYEELCKHLSVHDNVLVQREDGEYCVFSNNKDADGNFRDSGWNNAETTKFRIGDNYGYTKEYIEKYSSLENWKIPKNGVFDNPKERFKEKEFVLIGENAEEECNKYDLGWDEEKEKMVGKVLEIYYCNGSDYNVFDEYGDSYPFPHSCLFYPIEEEKKEEISMSTEEMLATLRKRGVIKNKEVII